MKPFLRILLIIVGVLVLLTGAVWFLQGISILPGSGMSGQTRWAINGAIAVVIGMALIVLANLRRVPPPRH